MSDYTQNDAPRRASRAPGGDPGPADRAAAGGTGREAASQPLDDDPLAALQRLQDLTPGPAAGSAPSAGSQPSTPRTRALSAPSRPRPRPAARPTLSRLAARIAAPLVFLVAVVVVVSLLFHSGVIGGTTQPVNTPTPHATKTKGGGQGTSVAYRKYEVKAGDTLSGIAVKFGSTTSDIRALNPRLGNTLVVGTTIRIPAPAPSSSP